MSTIEARKLRVASPIGENGIVQPAVSFTHMHVAHRAVENEGGVMLSITQPNQKEIKFLLDERTRKHLRKMLKKPGKPIKFRLPSSAGRNEDMRE